MRSLEMQRAFVRPDLMSVAGIVLGLGILGLIASSLDVPVSRTALGVHLPNTPIAAPSLVACSACHAAHSQMAGGINEIDDLSQLKGKQAVAYLP